MKRLLYGEVVKGKNVFDNPQELSIHLAKLEGKKTQTTIEQRKEQRTLDQNSYYWLLVGILAEEFGYWKKEMHDALRLKFLMIEKGKLPTVRSTTKLNTKEMTEYIDNIKMWSMAEFNIFLPDADTNIEWGDDNDS